MALYSPQKIAYVSIVGCVLRTSYFDSSIEVKLLMRFDLIVYRSMIFIMFGGVVLAFAKLWVSVGLRFTSTLGSYLNKLLALSDAQSGSYLQRL